MLEFAIPDRQHAPAHGPQRRNVRPVAFDIAIEFNLPIARIRFWPAAVEAFCVRVLMPKTSMNENSAPIPPADDVRFSRKFFRVKPVSNAQFAQNRPHGQFRLGLFRLNPPHVLGTACGGEFVHAGRMPLLKLPVQPIEQSSLIGDRRPADLRHEFQEGRTIRRHICRAFVANRTNSAEVLQPARATHRLVADMPDVKPSFPARIGGMRFSSGSPAHLAGETIAIQDECASLLRDAALKRRLRLGIEQQILARPQIGAVIVR